MIVCAQLNDTLKLSRRFYHEWSCVAGAAWRYMDEPRRSLDEAINIGDLFVCFDNIDNWHVWVHVICKNNEQFRISLCFPPA